MLDFAKLGDPDYQEQCRQEREAEEARIAALDARINRAIDLCLYTHYDTLSDKERSFVRSAMTRFRSALSLTEPQLKWLFDIAHRLDPAFDKDSPTAKSSS